MRLMLIWCAATFAIFNSFLIWLVEDLSAKLVLGLLFLGVVVFAVYVDHVEKQESKLSS